ncbi:DUF2388 domain-containing protein [Pseudomonas citronellolis]|uniref:DUF2388 domain-containing protein n=1 Tax=Pseudomonas citronellolis TaxID=53408 RepID=UPI0023E4444C|nr:DUF2388 domain-containing protein [Pseudomonas citronellolis]MDF3932512.1 DUF2388 domain-containing protein [Pseudomonas citronellolis]
MRIPGAALALVLSSLPVTAAFAEDAGFWRGVLSTGATTASSYLTSGGDHKLIGPLADDAGSFVASEGAIRGPYLEAELQRLRGEHPELQQRSDLELASALLGSQAAP